MIARILREVGAIIAVGGAASAAAVVLVIAFGLWYPLALYSWAYWFGE